MDPATVTMIVIGVVSSVMSISACATSIGSFYIAKQSTKVSLQNENNVEIQQELTETQHADGTKIKNKKQTIKLDLTKTGDFAKHDQAVETGRQNDVASILATGSVNVAGLLRTNLSPNGSSIIDTPLSPTSSMKYFKSKDSSSLGNNSRRASLDSSHEKSGELKINITAPSLDNIQELGGSKSSSALSLSTYHPLKDKKSDSPISSSQSAPVTLKINTNLPAEKEDHHQDSPSSSYSLFSISNGTGARKYLSQSDSPTSSKSLPVQTKKNTIAASTEQDFLHHSEDSHILNHLPLGLIGEEEADGSHN